MSEGGRASAQAHARVGGLLYLVIIVTALFAEAAVRSRLVVSGDAAATAQNILSHESLWRLGLVSDLIAFACDIAVAWILYVLLTPISQSLALLAAFFRLAYSAIVGANVVNHAAALLLLTPTRTMAGFNPHQQQDLAYQFIRFHGYGYNIALVFFGIHCVLIGNLIFRSGYLPRIFGIFLPLAGGCYIVNSFFLFLAPHFQNVIFPYILLPGALAEWSFTFWLLVMGINLQKWPNQRKPV